MITANQANHMDSLIQARYHEKVLDKDSSAHFHLGELVSKLDSSRLAALMMKSVAELTMEYEL